LGKIDFLFYNTTIAMQSIWISIVRVDGFIENLDELQFNDKIGQFSRLVSSTSKPEESKDILSIERFEYEKLEDGKYRITCRVGSLISEDLDWWIIMHRFKDMNTTKMIRHMEDDDYEGEVSGEDYDVEIRTIFLDEKRNILAKYMGSDGDIETFGKLYDTSYDWLGLEIRSTNSNYIIIVHPNKNPNYEINVDSIDIEWIVNDYYARYDPSNRGIIFLNEKRDILASYIIPYDRLNPEDQKAVDHWQDVAHEWLDLEIFSPQHIKIEPNNSEQYYEINIEHFDVEWIVNDYYARCDNDPLNYLSVMFSE
jgi:hypothetical protein